MKTCIWPVIYVQGVFCVCTLGFLDRVIYRVWLYAARMSSDGGIVVGSGSLGGVFDFASSEFDGRCLITCHLAWGGGWVFGGGFVAAGHAHRWGGDGVIGGFVFRLGGACGAHRSEEHTSELQSRGHLVCRLLLEETQLSVVILAALK